MEGGGAYLTQGLAGEICITVMEVLCIKGPYACRWRVFFLYIYIRHHVVASVFCVVNLLL